MEREVQRFISSFWFEQVAGLMEKTRCRELLGRADPELPLGHLSLFLKRFFLKWTILKVFIESVMICFCFMFFGHKECGILAPRPEVQLTVSALEGEVLTTRPPGKFLDISGF